MNGVYGVFRSVGGMSGGVQVATVNASTSFRTKMRGKVPPRLDTLGVLVWIREEGREGLTWLGVSCRSHRYLGLRSLRGKR